MVANQSFRRIRGWNRNPRWQKIHFPYFGAQSCLNAQTKTSPQYDRKAYRAKAVGDYGYAARGFFKNYKIAESRGDSELMREFLEEAIKAWAIHRASTKGLDYSSHEETAVSIADFFDERRYERLQRDILNVLTKFSDPLQSLRERSQRRNELPRFEHLLRNEDYVISIEHVNNKIFVHGFNRSESSPSPAALKQNFHKEFDGIFPFESIIGDVVFQVQKDGSFEAILNKRSDDSVRSIMELKKKLTPSLGGQSALEQSSET